MYIIEGIRIVPKIEWIKIPLEKTFIWNKIKAIPFCFIRLNI